jgi:hypothetical protein
VIESAASEAKSALEMQDERKIHRAYGEPRYGAPPEQTSAKKSGGKPPHSKTARAGIDID